MIPTTFPEMNKLWAADQKPYLPLPSYSDGRETISCWHLTWRERLYLLLTGKLWLRQLNFGEPLQAQAPSVEDPFKP